jgi:hypothetical protein
VASRCENGVERSGSVRGGQDLKNAAIQKQKNNELPNETNVYK